jgi:SAM-dependent methyltransferase
MKPQGAEMYNPTEMARAWDRASREYLARRPSRTDDICYGNLAPFESELGLLDEVRLRHVLDLGCGGGHNAVACAQRGGLVTAIDSSEAQIRAARWLGRAEDVQVEWMHADVTEAPIVDNSMDLILAVQLLQYVTQVDQVLPRCHDFLADGGILIASIDHPLHNCFWDTEDDELVPYPVRPYDQPATRTWEFGPGMPMRSRHWPLGMWVDAFVDAGLQIVRLVEALAPADVCDDLWPEDSPLAPLRLIPHTAIWVVTKPYE